MKSQKNNLKIVKRQILILLCLLAFMLTGIPAEAQKVAIMGYRGASGEDQFSFVALQDLTSSDVIRFTEAHYECSNNAFKTSSHFVLTYTPPAGGIEEGDVIVINEYFGASSINLYCPNGTDTDCGTVTRSGNQFLLNTVSFELLYAYEDTDTDISNGITDIYAVFVYDPTFIGDHTIDPEQDPTCDYPNAVVVDEINPTSPFSPQQWEYKVNRRCSGLSIAQLEDPTNYRRQATSQVSNFLNTDKIGDFALNITCVPNITQDNDPGECGAVVSYDLPVVGGAPPFPAPELVEGQVSGTFFLIGTTTNTYRVTDICGIEHTCSFDVVVSDAEEPLITCPADITVECGNDISQGATSMATAMDNCTGITITNNDTVVSGTCGNTQIIMRTFTATDENGLTATCSQMITVNPSAGPTIIAPADVTIACADEADPNAAIAVTTVGCGLGSSVEISDPVLDGGPNCPKTQYIYTYTITDDCGRTASDEQIFTIEAEGPEISCPPDMTVACFAEIAVNANDAIVSTACGLGATTTVSGPEQSGQSNCSGATYTYTYTAMDDCGNSSSCSQTFTIQSNEPVITCPSNQIVNCFEDIDANPDNLTVTTNCGLGYVAYVRNPQISGAPGCNGTVYTYTYVVIDDCGRIANCQQEFLIQNNPPSVTVPDGQTVNCFSEINVSPGDVSVVTDCPNDTYTVTVLQPPVISGGVNCTGATYTYTYRVKDNCNRIVEVERVFTNAQTNAPTITAPVDQMVDCLGSVNINTDNAIVSTTCGDNQYSLTVEGPVINGEVDCTGTTYTYNYIVTDACGRTASDEQVYTVANEGPTINCPGDLQITDCDNGAYLSIINAWLQSVTASTTCGYYQPVTNNFDPSTLGMCYWNLNNEVTFSVTDNCGRTSTCTAMIIIFDNEPPVIYDQAQDQYEICGGNSQAAFNEWVANNGYAGAVDGCSQEALSWSTIPNNPVFPDCVNGPISIPVTFVVKDVCGNKASTTATFQVLHNSGSMVDQGGGEIEQAITPGFELKQNQPNPFRQTTTIGFNLPESGPVSLKVFDVSGRMIYQTNGEYAKGQNEIELNRGDLPVSGILYYQLSTHSGYATKKMILLE